LPFVSRHLDVLSHCRIDGSHGSNGERRVVCRVLVRKPEGKRALGRPRPRWEGSIKMDLIAL